ncbi:MAG TPA: nucleotidyltransferase family protein, partial [Tepidisphaeraceae bacterium]|nr:nucleotidyltransferase family protein [Tepidisphaeraceae bacterium]
MSEGRVQLQLGELPRESRVLLELLKDRIRADEPAPAARDQVLGCDPPSLVALARHNRVGPLLCHALKQAGFLLADDPALQKLQSHYRHNAARALQLSHALSNLLDKLSRQIDVIPFKGLLLAAGAYGGVSLREAGDLDLLVKQQDIVRAADLLASLGHRPIFPTSTPREAAFLQRLAGERRAQYLRRHCEHHLVSGPTQINVDLHWAIALREFSLQIDTDALWRRARTISFHGCPTLAMCPEDKLLVLCINGAKDCWSRLDR